MRIFVTGKNGKVGNAFFEYMCRRHPDVMVDRVSVKPDVLCQLDFSGYDAVYCCIGITDENSSELFSVNRDLCFEIAKKSRDEGVKDFIYLSSMAVYDFSESSNMSPVCADTPANPVRNYGRSKIEGEKLIKQLSDDSFRVHIVRAPSIYGYGLDAYLQYYKRQADRRVFLDAFHDMKRSAIYADNLSELVYLICTGNNAESLSYYFPQNRDAMSYIEFIKAVSLSENKKPILIKVPQSFESILFKNKRIRDRYRAVMYDMDLSGHFNWRYNVVSSKDSVRITFGDFTK